MIWALLLTLVTLWMLACCWFDWHRRRIPNSLILSGWIGAMLAQGLLPPGTGLLAVASPGAVGWVDALLASATMLLLGLGLWKVRLFGAADAKMLVAIAAVLGPPGVLPVLLLSIGAGGVLALLTLMVRRMAGHPHPTMGPSGQASTSLPYALAITVATLGYIAWVRFELWGR